MATIAEALAVARQCFHRGQWSLVEQTCSAILRADPDNAAAFHLLGLIALRAGQPQQAIPLLRRAVECNASEAEYCWDLALVLQGQGDLNSAAACFQEGLRRAPEHAIGHYNLGVVYQNQGRFTDAAARYQKAIEVRPDFAEAYVNLGFMFQRLGDAQQAELAYRRAIELNPRIPEAYNNLGAACEEQGRFDDALPCFDEALKLRPGSADSYTNRANALRNRGDIDEALACYRQALALAPDFRIANSNMLYTMQYQADVTPEQLAAAHAEWNQRQAARFAPQRRPADNDRSPERPLQLGFVSPDLRQHPVATFLIRLLENLPVEQCRIVCYSDHPLEDVMNARFRAAAHAWRTCYALSDDALAEQIRADRIDVLFDLAGHTSTNRLLMFARKPAPIQITWIGYEGTTGLETMDYLLADAHAVPPGHESFYREQVLRLPDNYVCYDPPRNAPEVAPLPAPRAGHVTFASLNNPAKLNRRVVATWADILRRVPDATLLLKYRSFDNEAMQTRFRQRFADEGVDPKRITFEGLSPYPNALTVYHHVDLALDPFPFSGSLTTCDALWMGVPVITCPGRTFAGRHSLTHLANVGLREFVARDLDDYVALAVRWANNLDRLAELRSTLRANVAGSTLCDGGRFAENWLRVIRDVWRRWCRS